MWITNADLWRELQTVKRLLFRLQKPVPPIVIPVGERIADMQKFMQYAVAVAPVPGGIDAVDQELTVTVGGVIANHGHYNTEGGTAEFEALVDSTVRLELLYADAGGNKSQEPCVVEFTALDVIGPATPATDALSVQCTGERIDPDPEPEPVIE